MIKTTVEYIVTYSHHANTVANAYRTNSYDDVRKFVEEYKADDDVEKWYLINRVETIKFLGITIKSSVTDLESWHEE